MNSHQISLILSNKQRSNQSTHQGVLTTFPSSDNQEGQKKKEKKGFGLLLFIYT